MYTILSLQQKIHAALESERDRNKLKILTERFPVKATLLPIKSVGVQVSTNDHLLCLLFKCEIVMTSKNETVLKFIL